MLIRLLALLISITRVLSELSAIDNSKEDYDFFSLHPSLNDRWQETHFYDTRMIPENRLVTLYLLHDQAKRVFFDVDSGHSPVALSVTPCSSAVRWKLFFKPSPKHLQVAEDKTHPTELTLLSEQVSPNPMAYESNKNEPGLYILELTATDSNSNVKLHGSTHPGSDWTIPRLPGNSGPNVTQIEDTSVTVKWFPSPGHDRWISDLFYCISWNEARSYASMCSVEAALKGDQPIALPKYVGFGFAWEQNYNQQVTRAQRKTKKPHQKSPIELKCLGNETSYKLTSLKPATTYYVNVFAVNLQTNNSIAYENVNFTTNGKIKPPFLNENQLTVSTLNRDQNYMAVYSLEVITKTRFYLIGIQACTGEISSSLSHENKTIAHEKSDNFVKMILKYPKLGIYTLKIYGSKKESQMVKLAISKQRKKFPFPIMPEDIEIKVKSDTSANCSSHSRTITIEFDIVDPYSTYCLNYKQLDKNAMWVGEEFVKIKYGYCNGDIIKGKGLIASKCQQYGGKFNKLQTISEVLTGLNPLDKYLIDITASVKDNSRTYEPVVLKALDCV